MMSYFEQLTEWVMKIHGSRLWRGLGLAGLIFLSCGLVGCEIPRVNAEERLFSHVNLEFIGDYILPRQTVDGTIVGGLSGIVYSRRQERFYAISDDRSDQSPARFYTLQVQLNPKTSSIGKVVVESATILKRTDGTPFPKGGIDPEAIAFSPHHSLYISSEGDRSKGINPFLCEFNLESGQQQSCLPLPHRYLIQPQEQSSSTLPPQGVQNNLAFESLAIHREGDGEPFRLFTATESALLQDFDGNVAQQGARSRFLHYLINKTDPPLLVAEHLYPLDFVPLAVVNGLTDFQPLNPAGQFLGLERAFGPQGFSVKLFQFTTATATDTSAVPSFKGNLGSLRPIRKRLLLDLNTLGIHIDNVEGMTVGPRLADGSQSLLMVSDDNFNQTQVTQFLLFRLIQSP